MMKDDFFGLIKVCSLIDEIYLLLAGCVYGLSISTCKCSNSLSYGGS